MEIRMEAFRPMCGEAPDVGQLRHAIQIWGKAAPDDRTANGQFLSTFAVFLVKHFREEEARPGRGRAQDSVKRRLAHRRLVERLARLMNDLGLGLDVELGIRAFIMAWQAHQEIAAFREAAEEPEHEGLGHFDAGRSASGSLRSGDYPDPWCRMVAAWPGSGSDEDPHGPERLHPLLPGLRPAGVGD